MSDFLTVPREDIETAWPHMLDRVEFGVERSHERMTADGIKAKAIDGDWDLHIVLADDEEVEARAPLSERILCVLATQFFEEMTGRRICSIRFLGGVRRVEWIWLIAAVELFALQNGCHMMSFVARRGLAKELRDFDYRQASVLLEKSLQPFKAEDNAGREKANGPGRAADRPACPSAVPAGVPGSASPT